MAQLDGGHDVHDSVDLAVALAGEPVPDWSPEEASRGAVPFQEAKWALFGKRVMSPTSTRRRAAPEGPMPCRSIRLVPVAATSALSSLFAAFFRA